MSGRIKERKTGSGGQMRCCIFPSFRSAARSAGFTLIELLAALAVLGILGASLAGVLRNAMDSVDQAQRSVADLTRLRSLQRVLGSALREALPLELSAVEQRALAAQEDYSKEQGTLRFRGEELALGFCLARPFFSPDRDGYMHWVVLEIVPDETEQTRSLWLRDISYLPGVDNPAGDDWSGLDGAPVERLPAVEVCLVRDAPVLSFRYLSAADESGETGEIEPELIEGDYASAVPATVELDIRLAKGLQETMTFDCFTGEDLF